MPTYFFVNVNFVCNERCVFCAAGLANGPSVEQRRRLTLADLESWLGDDLPGPEDTVSIAGGEPTIHRELFEIVGHLAQRRPAVLLFTNGVRLANPVYAQAALDAGITRFEIALYGATPASHDAITRRAGSFEDTIEALNVLGRLRQERDFVVVARLLVARHTVGENPAIVRLVHDRVEGVDAISLNPLLLSEDARAADAAISWDEARESTNQSATLIRRFGYELRHEVVPLCVFDGDNAERVRREVVARLQSTSPAPHAFRYIDPVIAAHGGGPSFGPPSPVLPLCDGCDYVAVCGRVEQWYVERFGTSGLRRMHLDEPVAAER